MSPRPEFRDLPEVAPLGFCGTRFDSGGNCHRWATRHIVVGCVHEHVKAVASCDPCAKVTLAGGAWCKLCFDMPDDQRHVCKLLGKPENEPEEISERQTDDRKRHASASQAQDFHRRGE